MTIFEMMAKKLEEEPVDDTTTEETTPEKGEKPNEEKKKPKEEETTPEVTETDDSLPAFGMNPFSMLGDMSAMADHLDGFFSGIATKVVDALSPRLDSISERLDKLEKVEKGDDK